LALLKEQGYDVTGVFLKVWSPDFLPCDWREERRSAMRVCATLDVPFMTLDCEKEYKKEVVDYMIREYSEGRVPNPDIFCNKYVKFGVFLDKARELGADFIATGHYARIAASSQQPAARENTKADSLMLDAGYSLLESVDTNKDQSYFLYTLSQEQLKHALFPIGHLTKPEVRKLAAKFKLPTAEKKDSQGLCFIGKIDMEEFLAHYIETKEGNVLDTEGEIVGTHRGAILYTIGERHGFTITKKTANEPRLFVVSKDLAKNTITVADKTEEMGDIYSTKEILMPNTHFISGKEPDSSEISVRIRYRQEKQAATLEKRGEGYAIVFQNPQNGIAVGQSAVLYDKDVCLGGGIIEKAVR
jgi:tRNA-specific 2-thiouridylase